MKSILPDEIDKVTPDQVRTFWAMIADRRWDDSSYRMKNRYPRPNYLWYIKATYIAIKDGSANKKMLNDIISDLYCFKGYEVERRLRNAR